MRNSGGMTSDVSNDRIIDLVDVMRARGASTAPVVCTPIGQVRESPHARQGWTIRSSGHVVVVLTAGAGLHVVDGVEHRVEPGMVVHLRPDSTHRWLVEEQFDGWVLTIQADVCPPGLFDRRAHRPIVVLGRSIEVAHALVASLTQPELLPAKAQDRLRTSIAGVLLELIALAGEDDGISPERAVYQQLVSDFRRELELRFATTRSVADYAQIVGCSARTLTRATRETLGQSPKEVIDARVTYAATRLLRSTEISVAWIARQLGFSQASNFAKFFKRQTGMSPAEYRANMGADPTGH